MKHHNHYQENRIESKNSQLIWKLEEGVLTIHGSGIMHNWNKGSAPWNEQRETIQSVSIQKGIESIGNYAFFGCNHLQTIQIPDTVSYIGNSVFEDCFCLSTIVIPNSVTEIGFDAFNGCYNLKTLLLPKHIKSISSNLFFYCTQIDNITIPSRVTEFGMGAFYNCSNLREINIPDSVENVAGAFIRCHNIEEIQLPETTKNIDGAFFGCSSLTHFIIPKKVESIGDYTFANCHSLRCVVIPESVKNIGTAAFYGCHNLTIIYYLGSEEEWSKIIVSSGNDFLSKAKICFGSFDIDKAGKDATEYVIEYHSDIKDEQISEIKTIGVFGEKTKTCKIEELGFEKTGYVFEGWRAYREEDEKWFLRKLKGTSSWQKLKDDKLPSGYVYSLLNNGRVLKAPAKNGLVKLYAQWGGKKFEVLYHEDDNCSPAEEKTAVTYGTPTRIMNLKKLGFERPQSVFKGWKIWREIDGKWRLKNKDGKAVWQFLKNDALEEGFEYILLKDGQSLIKAATSGRVHLYAQWENEN